MSRPAALAAGLMASLPFLVPVHRLPIPSFHSEWLAAVLGLACVLAVVCTRRLAPLAFPAVALAPLCLALVVLLQVALGLPASGANAAVSCGYLVFAAALAFAGHNVAQAMGLAGLHRTLAWSLLGGGLAGAIIGVAQYAGLAALAPGLLYPASPTPGEGVWGNLGQQNHFATHIALALGAAAHLVRQRALGARPGAAIALLLITALALSASRSSLLYLGCIALAWMATGAGKRVPWRGIGLLLAAGTALVAALSIAGHHGLLGPRLARLVAYSQGIGPRAYLWAQAWRMAATHPWLGVGIDRFAATVVMQLRPGDTVYGIDQYAHNLGLQLLAVAGVAGLLAVGVPLLAFVRRLLRTRLTPDAMLGWIVLGILFTHSMLEQPLYYAYFLALAAFVAGGMESAAFTPTWHGVRAGGGIFACAALLALCVVAGDYGRLADHFYGADAGDPFDARHDALLHDLHRDPFFGALTELMAPQGFVPADAPAADKLALNTRLFGYAPIAEVAFRQAALLAEAGHPDDARRQFRQATLAYPGEAAQYAGRVEMLAGADPVHYGALAAYVQTLAMPGRPAR